MKHICLVSGGKDSQATAIWCKENIENVEYLFCDTKWEDKVTYNFLKEFEKQLGTKLTSLRSMGFVQLAKKKKRFPSTKAKFCTQKLKIEPMIDYLLTLECDVTIYQGIRWEESTNRSTFNKSEDFFHHYFTPYGYDKKGKPKYYTYRKKDIIKWLDSYSCDVERPIISWTTKQVFEYILYKGYMPNVLYQYGFTRVGCFPCIQCNKSEIAKVAEYRPERIEYIEKLEKELDSTFFPPKYIPERWCSKKVEVKDKKTGQLRTVMVPTIRDVIKYVQGKQKGSGLFIGSHCQNPFLPCE